jgi:hypothetical protein
LLDGRASGIVRDVHDDDRRSFAREQERSFAADAATAARDECNLVLESHEYDPLSRS